MNKCLEFTAETHTYTLEGVELPSVTQIVRFLSYDVTATAKSWLRDVAADRGTRIHEYCMLYDYEELPDEIDYDCAGYVKAYLAFCRDYKPDWWGIERMGWCERHGTKYAGTVDRFGKIDGENVIVDIKSGSTKNHAQHAAQLTGYAGFGLIESPALYNLYLTKKGTYEYVKRELAIEVFDACLTLHKALGRKRK